MKKELKDAALALCEASYPATEEEKEKYAAVRNVACDVLKKKKEPYTAEDVAAVSMVLDRLLKDAQSKVRNGEYEEANVAYEYYTDVFDAIVKNGETMFEASAPFLESIMSQAFDEKSFERTYERAEKLIKKCKETMELAAASDIADLFEVVGTLNWYAARMTERGKEGADKAGDACIKLLHLTGELRNTPEE